MKGHVLISPQDCRIDESFWTAFTRFIKYHNDFYQLLAISIYIEARLHQIKPSDVEFTPQAVKFNR